MTLELTPNAQARMQERSIPEDEVRAALADPDHLAPCFEKCWHARKRLQGRTLEVIFARDLHLTRVLTAYWQEPSA
jgi:hypothetical protein